MLKQLSIPILIKDNTKLIKTVEKFTNEKKKISKTAYNKGKPLRALDLHKKTYRKIKNLNAQMSCSVIRLVAGAYSSAKSNKHDIEKPFVFKKQSALFLIGKRGRDASFKKDKTISIWTVSGRTKYDYSIPSHFIDRFNSAKLINSLTLSIKNNKLKGNLCITIEVPEPKGIFPVGVDLNETNPIVATDINNKTFFVNGLDLRIKNNKLRKVKSRLKCKLATKKAEGKNTHSVVRTLKRLSCKQRNRINTYAKTIAKQFVNWLEPNSIIIFEDLKNIPQVSKKMKLRKGVKRRLSGWYHRLLRECIINVAELKGFAYDYTSAYQTSIKCNVCGQIGVRQKHSFTCSCGNKDHADKNASKNIRDKFTILRSSGVQSITLEASSGGKPLNLLGGN